ncbi:MAG: PqqD family protein [Candidatus Krumholzibacteriota bacterium]
MALVPQKACGWTQGNGPDQVVVLQPRFRAGLLGRYLQPRLKESKKFVRIPLEERGSYLWTLMDGKMTVGEMATAFGRDFPAENDQIPERVATYLYQMAENHLISFANLNI